MEWAYRADKRAEPRLPARRADPSQAAGYDKRGDRQIDRARVLEVRIHSPPAESHANFRFLSDAALAQGRREDRIRHGYGRGAARTER